MNFMGFSITTNDDLRDVIANRHGKLAATAEYKEVEARVNGAICKLGNVSPEARKIILELEADVNELQGICFDAAYRDGMRDLVVSMALNKSGIMENYSISNKGTA